MFCYRTKEHLPTAGGYTAGGPTAGGPTAGGPTASVRGSCILHGLFLTHVVYTFTL